MIYSLLKSFLDYKFHSGLKKMYQNDLKAIPRKATEGGSAVLTNINL